MSSAYRTSPARIYKRDKKQNHVSTLIAQTNIGAI